MQEGTDLTTVASVGHDSGRPTKKRKLHNPKPTIVQYDAPSAGQETALYHKLRAMDDQGQLKRFLKWSRKLLLELGPCAADLLWRQIFLGSIAEAYASQDFERYRQVVEDWRFDMPSVNPKSTHYNVTPQFTSLLDALRLCGADSHGFNGLIYVKRPTTAVMLAELLRAVDDDFPHLRPFVLTESDILRHSQDETLILDAFSTGTYNLLITTKCIDGSKLHSVTAVIHFNLTEDTLASPTVMHTPVTTVYMAEKDNSRHQDLIQSFYKSGASLTHARSPGTLHSEVEPPLIAASDFIEDPTTGARIYRQDAVPALCRYLDYLRDVMSTGGVSVPHIYTRGSSGTGEDVIQLDLPHNVDLPKPLQVLARRISHEATVDTSFVTCQHLFDQGYLDYRFFTSHGPSQQPEVETDGLRTANQSANTRCYPRRRPSLWTRALQRGLDRLYPLVVTVSAFRNGVHAPMLILSRLPWPRFDSFSVFSNGQGATVRLTPGSPLSVEESKQQLLVAYTMRMARALANKPLECKAENLFYLYAPLGPAWDSAVLESLAPWQFLDVEAHIAWGQVTEAADHWAQPLVPDGRGIEERDVDDAIIQDRAVEFTNRHFATKLRRDLTPLSKPDAQSREGKYDSYLDFCKEHRKEFQGVRDDKQPLIEVALVPPIVNNLSPASKVNSGSTQPSTKVFIPELCHRFTIPASSFRTALLLPSIMHMLECMLLVKEMSVVIFESKIQERHLLEAVTPSATQVERNYERLELLGDTLLKNITSMYYFVTMPTKREGALNGARAQAVCNKALHANALAAGIPPWIQSKSFVPKIWTPYIVKEEKGDVSGSMEVDPPADGKPARGPRKSKQQKRQDEVDVQWLGDKTVADVVEALIGAAFHNGGIETVLQVMYTLQFKMPGIRCYDDFWLTYKPHMSSYKASLPAKTVNSIKAITGYDFPVPAILAEALTHGSLTAGNQVSSYDRLEFLGDSILDFHVVWYIFQSHPHLSPGGLSLLKGAMVSNQTLATIAVLSGLHEHVRCSPDVQSAIQLYAHKIFLLRDQEYQLADAEGRLPAQFWLDVEAPKALGDVVEAVVAAICLSDRFATAGVDAFFRKVLQPFYARHIRVHTLAAHPSKALFELLQAEGCQQHAMRKRPAEGGTLSEVVLHSVVVASAVDVTTHASMRKAANAALDALASDPGFVARTCDCKAQRSGKKAQKAKQAGYED
ncbi:hypothetical protein PHLGIDRAFT_494339 [Phlebiopsis gigantea 11061_1 CR5-6]|uniref:RNase III domain-containing protein n=1 Tax=Phlebiopsis gigantea (strain 11061_1 CR5-6) TaxID=745531 RepID=A0A0C3NYX3_PHLG1|nr:hypothetical protein PHLGIDRAFT_494339 [Phlebiopsis gigantea 11061_1 CR5-6]